MKNLLLAGAAIASLASGAHAADLGVPRGPVAAAVVAPVFNWTGFYLGGTAGYWTSSATTYIPTVPFTGIGFPNISGVTLGGVIGYRYQFNSAVIGVEGDLSWLGNKTAAGPIAANVPAEWRLRANWDASVRASVGFAVDRALFYVTGGISFIDAKGCGVANPPLVNACSPGTSHGGTRAGWTVGGGIEYAVTQNWTVRGEYLYANYGTRTYIAPAAGAGTVSSQLQTHKFRVGVNYLFSTGSSTVVARY